MMKPHHLRIYKTHANLIVGNLLVQTYFKKR